MRKQWLWMIVLVVALLVACDSNDGAPSPAPLLATRGTRQERTTIRFAIYDWKTPACEDLIAMLEEESVDLWVQAVSIDDTLAIARALSTRTALILAAESTGELDSATGQQILALLRHVVDQEATTVLVATHDLTVDLFADKVVHLEDGRLTVPGE